MMKPCEALPSNSSPFFSDVEGVVDLQVALVIIIKKLQKIGTPKKKIYSKYCTLVCIGHAMSAVCLETKQVSCTLQNKDKNQKTSKLESSSGNKTYKANSKMVPKSWPNNNMCNE